eukprot:TRINITY_DN4120_c0_g4_i1.p1 TRINITY_DN4120_c0_g4~~TRINITY_DN4120_c0_g4_i1.p1  ORF type:complete len:440 (-),score=88.80 TRINITY_DN4120_c0_g4_i1:396-1685(-)
MVVGPPDQLQVFVEPQNERHRAEQRHVPGPARGEAREEPIWVHRKHYDAEATVFDGVVYPERPLELKPPPADRQLHEILPAPELRLLKRIQRPAPPEQALDNGAFLNDPQPAPPVGQRAPNKALSVRSRSARERAPSDAVTREGLGHVDGDADSMARGVKRFDSRDHIGGFLQMQQGADEWAEALSAAGHAGGRAAPDEGIRVPKEQQRPRDQLSVHGVPRLNLDSKPEVLETLAGNGKNLPPGARRSIFMLGTRGKVPTPRPRDHLDILKEEAQGEYVAAEDGDKRPTRAKGDCFPADKLDELLSERETKGRRHVESIAAVPTRPADKLGMNYVPLPAANVASHGNVEGRAGKPHQHTRQPAQDVQPPQRPVHLELGLVNWTASWLNGCVSGATIIRLVGAPRAVPIRPLRTRRLTLLCRRIRSGSGL